MKILHLAPIKGFEEGNISNKELKLPPEGISASVPKLAEGQFKSGKKVGVISSFLSSRSVSESIYWATLSKYNIFSLLLKSPYKKVINEFGKPDLLNIHDIYNLKQILFSIYFLSNGIKVYVTPRGTFSEVALARSRYKKLFFLFFYRLYARFIYAFIALNQREKEQISKIFPEKKIIIIGNGVDYSETRNTKFEKHFEEKLIKNYINIGFLGRFDIYIKGLDILLNAYSKYQKKESNIKIRLSLLGEHRVREFDSKDFINRIKLDLPAPEMLEVSGPYYGLSKWEELAKLDLLIQPSRTEGMPNTVLEAMSSGVPCAVSPNTNVGEMIVRAKAGWIIDCSEKDILDFFLQVQNYDKKQLIDLGNNAKKYTKANLTWDNIGKINYF